MEVFFTAIGFKVTVDGVLTTTNWFARMIANVAVRNQEMIKINTNTFIIK